MIDLMDAIWWTGKGLLGLLAFYVMVRVGTMAVLKSYAEYLRDRQLPPARPPEATPQRPFP